MPLKVVVGLISVVGLSLGAGHFYQDWGTVNDKTPSRNRGRAGEVNGEHLPGLPPQLAGPVQTAEHGGTAAMKEFLSAHAKEIKDPRRAWIELDYVVLAGANDPGEARRVFQKVKARG